MGRHKLVVCCDEFLSDAEVEDGPENDEAQDDCHE